ncbi:sugar ABC transporter ATP-binding protein [Ruania alkalisoli]|uniref:Sugar ABC transporter ATP-binding protein n=1 Tax=Ruania alkalisoli TaxID=2779775 RepID=A0A7M1STL3_9MICO|nr:sugar ABC transporter ATP-binding protein [Ruania alkalisoli]QOR70845.1 sugar ABC transporter ATP-binding protein [Ruania alkalisoli]
MVPALQVDGLFKAFGGVPVLHELSFAVEPGSVVVLAGENGAGKSTLFNIVMGRLPADSGTVTLRGTELTHPSPRHARDLGVALVPQELAPYEDLSVAENIAVGREPRAAGFVLRRRQMRAHARELLAEFDVDIDPDLPMNRLSVALTQIVEIVKATSSGAKILLLDEPTSSIPEAEVERLYQVIRRLRDRGVAMVYTTHRMQEIEAIADRVVVLRDGGLTLDEPAREVQPHQIVTAMIGRELGTMFPERPAPGTTPVLEVNELRRRPGRPAVDLTVHAGEVVGLGGLVGAGRSATLKAIFGANRAAAGTVTVNGKALHRQSVRASIDAGLAFVPEDRKRDGLVLGRSILDNMTLPYIADYSRFGVMRSSARTAAATRHVEDMRLRYRSLHQLTETLSGGNQQKIVIARWMDRSPAVLLLDEPTRGVDVGARSEIYRIISELAATGLGVLVASSDMPELIGLTHRVLVMRDGAIAGELDRADLDAPDAQARIFHLASGEDAARHTTEEGR